MDDGSADSGGEIEKTFINEYPGKIFLYSRPDRGNHGASAARNLGIKKVSGDFITFLDSDDILLPDSLEIQPNAFRENPEAEAVCGTLQYWFPKNREGKRQGRDIVVKLGLETGKLYDPPNLLLHNLCS